jgi:hypothetical protein
VATGRELRRFEGHGDLVRSAVFSPDGSRVLTSSTDQTARLWNLATGEELARLVSFSDGTWAVMDRNGRFDASNGGDIAHLYWVAQIGEDLESISLDQLKERYYEPGLLSKKLGLNTEPLREAVPFTAAEPYPKVTLNEPTAADPVLHVTLVNRGGGIGRVVIWLNGKEMVADARPRGADSSAKSLSLELPLSAYNRWLKPGEKNRIEVMAYNAEGYLASRKGEVIYQPEGEAALPEITLWAIIVGISDYAGGEQIDLGYAAKDADDMAKAVELGASRLFGTKHVRIELLTTSRISPSSPAINVQRPTKGNIKAAFEGLADAKPDDIIFAYFSGHGVAVHDVYHYPTQEASSTNLDDPRVREQRSISSEELAQWLKRSPATRHQVMIFDTCAAGAATKSLIEPRNVSSDQIRALERLKDRTGVYVLMGSAADQVSWEATPFEQGLMTYALLLGMKGAALREDAYVDVSDLFSFVTNEVPQLAKDVGGIQRPYIVAPKPERIESFYIGKLTSDDRATIILRSPKPLLLRPSLQNEQALFDDLKLERRLRKRLEEAKFAQVYGGSPTSVEFVDADEMSGAIRPSGRYTVSGENVNVRLVLLRDGQTQELQVDGSRSDLDAFAEKIMQAIVRIAGEWK